MALRYYNRYENFIKDGEHLIIPNITITPKSSDKVVNYMKNKSRLDKLSQQFYNSPYFGWLIMVRNSEYGSVEWEIPDGATLFIPYPLEQSLQEYNTKIEEYRFYNGEK